MPDKVNNSFPITIYGDLEKFNDVTSKARCRIFYKYGNRNATYITDEFADKLIKTLPYTPVKGIYDEQSEDYTGHGAVRSLGRIYGIVPENPNFAWEKHIDPDGVEREYACVDVLLFTAIYKEAGDIVSKAQSMELYEKSIDGHWDIINGEKYFVFTEGCFLGLQVLGEEVEPCFEGAAFFSLYESLSQMLAKIEEYNLNLQDNQQGGKLAMPTINYKMSDNQKFWALWSLLNVNYNEEGNWTVDYDICDVYDDYAVVKNCSEGGFERIYYKKDETTDSVYVCGKEKCYIINVTEAEYNALNALKKACGSYEHVDTEYSEKVTANEELSAKNSEFEAKIAEYENTIATLNTEKDELNAQYELANNLVNETKDTLTEAQSALASLQTEYSALVDYKKGVELSEKQTIINSYADMLNDEVITQYTENIDNYSAMDLDMHLAYELKKSNPSVFKKTEESTLIPKNDLPVSGIESILSKYQK